MLAEMFSVSYAMTIHHNILHIILLQIVFLVRCFDAAGKDTCEWRVKNGHDCQAFYMKIDCAATCGYCGTD